MYRVKKLEDFIMYSYEGCELYIEKPLHFEGSEFLLVYEGRYRIKFDKDDLRILKLETKK
ncbi:MAG: hypothetical protein KKD38_03265 [Candidatus Delongbacteria bacterium]|nr:hypothetical protein [Candidatus Delongbacteria bacterium]MCG2761478.1 hypothetical protein [Candidatus Delongbacteria bacterium]